MKKKKRQYDYRVEKGTFTPLVFSVSGTSAPECQTFLRSLFTKIGEKEVKDIVIWHMPIESFQYFIILFRVNQVFTFYHFIERYSNVANWVRCKLSFLCLKSMLMCEGTKSFLTAHQ